MKKTVIALAVLGAVGVAHAQSNVTIYGVIQPSYDFMTVKSAAGVSTDYKQMSSNASRIGFMGSEDLGGGLKAVFKVEQDVDVVDDTAFGGNARDTYVGLSGKWGTVTFGNINSVYKSISGKYDAFEDTIGDYNSIMGISKGSTGTVLDFNQRYTQTANYASPVWNGAQLLANYAIVKMSSDAASEASNGTWGLGATYKNGPFDAFLAYESQKSGTQDWYNETGYSAATHSAEAWKIGAAYNFGQGTTVRGIYESVDSNAAGDSHNWLIGAEHKMNNVTLMANYISAGDAAGGDGAYAWNLGVDYAFSKRTSVQAVYSYLKNDASGSYSNDSNGDWSSGSAGDKISGFSARLKHTF